MLTVEKYIECIKGMLKTHSADLINELDTLSTFSFSKEVYVLDFTLYNEPTRLEFSIVLFVMDKEENEVFNEKNPFQGSKEIICDRPYFSMDKQDDFDTFYEENEDSIIPKEQYAFIQWFLDCWDKASGINLDAKVFFTHHESNTSYDIKNMKLVYEHDKYRN